MKANSCMTVSGHINFKTGAVEKPNMKGNELGFLRMRAYWKGD